jgi:hypothetical protein
LSIYEVKILVRYFWEVETSLPPPQVLLKIETPKSNSVHS